MRGRVLLAAVALALGVVLGGTGTASADLPTPGPKTPPTPAPPTKATLVPLTVVEGPSDRGDVSTENIVYGDCGYAWTFLYNTGGNDDKGLIDYGARSTLGNIVRVSWETHLHQGYFGTLLLRRSGTEWRWPWEGSTWSKSHYFDISPWGDGYYTGDLWYLDVWTALGYHCVGLWPYDYWYIS
jgi:hypothetical protein